MLPPIGAVFRELRKIVGFFLLQFLNRGYDEIADR